jgi:poly-gamma-glutamate synthesis protein (capsule biosynthesis protein)
MEKEKVVTLSAVGDIMLGDSPVCYGFGVGSTIEKFGPFFPFQDVAEELRKSDIRVGNLEVAISGFDGAKDSFKAIQYRGQPKAVEGLVWANFDVLSVATNHSMQHGRKALEETLDLLARHDIKFTGLEIPEKQITNHCFLEKKGFRICFLGYNFRPQQYFVDSPLWKKPDLELIKKEVDKVRDEVDLVIVSFHWGDEFIDYPSPLQVGIAHRLIDQGVNIILGHHPHILQGIEKYNGGIIAYSLGNFVFDMEPHRLRKSMILKCMISESLGIGYEVIPVIINKHHQPQIVGGKEGENLKEEIAKLSLKITESKSILENYNRELRKNLRKFRREIYWYYITHIHKYNPKHLFTNFLNAMKKRIVR